MEYFGVMAFILVMCCLSYPEKIKKLEAKVKILEKQRKGESAVSKLIRELVGKDCKITSEQGAAFTGKMEFLCHVLDYDEEWLKIRFLDKKNQEITKLIRVEDIEHIEILENPL